MSEKTCVITGCPNVGTNRLTIEIHGQDIESVICDSCRERLMEPPKAMSFGFGRTAGVFKSTVDLVTPPCTDPDCLKRPHGRGDVGCVSDAFYNRR